MIAGPCSVESEAQICGIAEDVKKAGAMFLRGGAFKPRTSPYAFQGLKYDGLELLKEARAKTGLPIVTEIMSPYDIEIFVRDVDIIQVGARNMQNFELLLSLIHICVLYGADILVRYNAVDLSPQELYSIIDTTRKAAE